MWPSWPAGSFSSSQPVSRHSGALSASLFLPRAKADERPSLCACHQSDLVPRCKQRIWRQIHLRCVWILYQCRCKSLPFDVVLFLRSPADNLQDDRCSGTGIGYDLSTIGAATGGVIYENTSVDRASRALILHPIAAGLAFIAQIIALASKQFGFLFASIIVFLAFIVSLACLVIDFAIFTLVRNAINSNQVGSPASFSNAIWLVLAATIALLIATIFSLFACCCGGDRRARKANKGYNDGAYVGNEPGMTQTTYAPQRRHWWSRR